MARRARRTSLDRIVDASARAGYVVTLAALLVVAAAMTVPPGDAGTGTDVVTFEFAGR